MAVDRKRLDAKRAKKKAKRAKARKLASNRVRVTGVELTEITTDPLPRFRDPDAFMTALETCAVAPPCPMCRSTLRVYVAPEAAEEDVREMVYDLMDTFERDTGNDLDLVMPEWVVTRCFTCGCLGFVPSPATALGVATASVILSDV